MSHLPMPPTLRPLLIALLLSSALGTAGAQDPKAAGRFLEDALKRYEARDVPGAIIQLKNALQQDKRLLPAHILLGKALLDDSNPAAAEISLQEALTLGASASEVVVPLARALLAQGKPAVLLEDPRLRPAGLPANRAAELHLVRAQAESDLGRDREAMASIASARSLQPNVADSWLAEVPLRLRANQFDLALAAANRAIELVPQLAQSQYLKGSVLHVQGDIQGAMAAYGAALKLDAEERESLLARAGLLIDQRQFDAASADLEVLRKAHARDPRAAYLRALLAEEKGERDLAQQALREVTDLIDPVPIDFMRYRPQLLLLGGLSHYGLNQYNKAKPLLETLLKQQPRSPAAKLLAQMLYSEGQVENGIVLLESYLRSQPRDAQALALLASGHSAQGRHDKATQLVNQGLSGRDQPALRSVLGQSLMRAGKLDAALTELERVWSRSPAQTEAGHALAMLYLRLKQPAKALPIVQSLLKARPKQAGLHHALGMVKAAQGDRTAARAAFEAALKLDPHLGAAQISLARLEEQAGNRAAAMARLQAMHLADEKAVEPMLELAAMAQKQQQWDEVQRWLDKAVLVSPSREHRADFALIDLHLRRDEVAKAIQAARALTVKAPQNLQALVALARSHLAHRDGAAARAPLLEANRLAGFDVDVLAEIGGLQIAAGDLANARHTLGKVLSTEPKHRQGNLLMASLELKDGALEKAEERSRQLLAREPRLSLAHLLAADVALARKNPAAALAALRKAHEVQPSTATAMRLFLHLTRTESNASAQDFAELWLRKHPDDTAVLGALGNHLASRRQFLLAAQTYERLLKLRPKHSETLNSLANARLQLNDVPAAVAAAEKAVLAAPQNGLALDTLAWALHLGGQSERALTLLRDVRLRLPENAEVRYHLAAVLNKLGRKPEAKLELQAALANPAGLESLDAAQQLALSLK